MKFEKVTECDTMIIDLRTAEEKQLVAESRSLHTVKLMNQIWQEHPEILSQETVILGWKPSCHHLEE